MGKTRILIGLSALVVAACSSSPRGPADIELRNGSNTSATAAGAVTAERRCGRTYTVSQGETLSSIARRCNVSARELASDNALVSPYTLTPGQVLRMPGPDVYVVQPGQNLYRIALAHGMSVEELARLNGLDYPYTIHPGQELVVTGQTDTRVLAQADTSTTSEGRISIESVPPSQTGPLRRAQPAVDENAPDFILPLRGELLSAFGPQEGGTRKDGWTIAARQGDRVRASADGEVVYAGNELQGYGELVLIRHEDNWVTAYAHNARLLVEVGDQVRQGDTVAEAGSSGNADRPQLYFEIRQGVRPVDPSNFLSRPS